MLINNVLILSSATCSTVPVDKDFLLLLYLYIRPELLTDDSNCQKIQNKLVVESICCIFLYIHIYTHACSTCCGKADHVAQPPPSRHWNLIFTTGVCSCRRPWPLTSLMRPSYLFFQSCVYFISDCKDVTFISMPWHDTVYPHNIKCLVCSHVVLQSSQ